MSDPPIHAWVGEQHDRRLDVEFDGRQILVYRQERYRDGSDSRRYRCLTLTPENASRLATALLAHAEKALDQRLPNQ